MIYNTTTKTMDSTLIFCYCITDGAIDDMSEEERTAMIIDITEIKEAMLKAGYNTPNEFK